MAAPRLYKKGGLWWVEEIDGMTGFESHESARLYLVAVTEPSPAAGRKHDGGKPPMALIPYAATREIARVLEFGAKKYASWNWAGGMDWSRLISAAERHLGAFKDGEDYDPETSLQHLAHAACCLVFLICYQLWGIGNDDRFRLPERVLQEQLGKVNAVGDHAH